MTANHGNPLSIRVFFDPICPWCYIGYDRLKQVLDDGFRGQVEVIWHGFQLNPDMPAQGMDRKLYLYQKFGGEAGYHNAYRPIIEAAAAQNTPLKLDAITLTPQTSSAHILLNLIQESAGSAAAEKFAVLLFERYFEAGQDISNADLLISLAVEAGFDEKIARSFLSADGTQEAFEDEAVLKASQRLQQDRLMASQLGINGVPFYIFNDRYSLAGAASVQNIRSVLESFSA
ncbi:MAG: DsbA family oxidoreductase [Alphaproteobacteria bacterium]